MLAESEASAPEWYASHQVALASVLDEWRRKALSAALEVFDYDRALSLLPPDKR